MEYNGTASEVTIPQNVTKINYYVFKNHTELQKVVLDGCTVEALKVRHLKAAVHWKV